jgi:hypothetical protein
MASGGLQPASVEQKADRAFVLAAVAETGGDLRYAAAKLKGDREVVMTAVKQSGGALWHASAKLKADPEVVLEAVKEDGGALWYASARLKSNREFALQCVTVNGNSLRYVATALKGDRELVLAALAQDHTALRYASASLQKDREIVQAARPPESTPEKPAVVGVEGTTLADEVAAGVARDTTASPDAALEAARLAQQRRAAGLVRAEAVGDDHNASGSGEQSEAASSEAASSGNQGLELVLHRRDGSLTGSDISTDEDFATVRGFAEVAPSRPPGARHRRLGSRDSETDGATTPPATPTQMSSTSAENESARKGGHIDFRTAGLIGLALARVPSRARAAEGQLQSQDSGGSAILTRQQTAPLPPLLSAETPPPTKPQATPAVSFAEGTVEKERGSSTSTAGGGGFNGTRRRKSSFRRQMDSLIGAAATDVVINPDELSPGVKPGALGTGRWGCTCRRRDREIMTGLLRCVLAFLCCCGLPLFALTVWRTGAVTDCTEVKDAACWEAFGESVIGIHHMSCKSVRKTHIFLSAFPMFVPSLSWQNDRFYM